MSVESSSLTGKALHILSLCKILFYELYLIPFIFFRMTLLLGPPGAGKTSLLLALAGTLPSGLKVNLVILWLFSFS
jgi:ABC-type transport system involved in cytochrome c biogenesis ATPase subunit